MSKGIDCSVPLTATMAARAKAAGFDFVGRYFAAGGYKILTKAEAERITAAGLRILTVWETSDIRARGGWNAGEADGKRAYACAKEIGMPDSGIIYFAVDYDAQDGEMETIAEYLRAARAQTGEYEIGVYGSYRVIEAMAARDVCKGFWQCVAWSYGKLSPARTVYQSDWSGTAAADAAEAKIGVDVDLNDCPDMNRAGIWNFEEDYMTGKDILGKLTDEEAWELVEKANRHAATLKPSAWAEEACAEGVASGLFSDGDHDGLVDNPQAFLKRQELAAVLDRAGLLD